MMRLESAARDLFEQLLLASTAQQHAASIAACEIALKESLIDDSIVRESLEQLRLHETLSSVRLTELENLVEHLDGKYFELQDKAEVNPDLQADALFYFRQARAVAAVAFAGGNDFPSAAMEAIYEASMAVDDGFRVFDAAYRAL